MLSTSDGVWYLADGGVVGLHVWGARYLDIVSVGFFFAVQVIQWQKVSADFQNRWEGLQKFVSYIYRIDDERCRQVLQT